MPIKRRHTKRRLDTAQEASAWASVFDAGYDFFGELPAIGVATDEYGRPSTDEARDAWQRLGARYLESPEAGSANWAREQFGDHHAR